MIKQPQLQRGGLALDHRPQQYSICHGLVQRCSRSPAAALAHRTASSCLGHSLSSRPRSLAPCRAQQRDIGGYTPADYITFSEDPTRLCHHHAEVVVDAPIDVCFSMWSDWSSLIDFLDLVAQIGLDNNTPEMALFQCFYRWRKLPTMEIVFLLERTRVEPNTFIDFKSVYGMPIRGQVDLQEQVDGQTKVKLYFVHPVPNLLVQLQIGPFGLETDLMHILKENLATYKSKVEALAPPDWQQLKQQAAERAKQQQQQANKRPKKPQQQQQPVQEAEQPPAPQPQQQPQPQQAPAAAAAPPARKQRASRRTASLAAAGAGDAAGSKPRSRATSRKTASVATGAEQASSSSSGAGRRRSRTSTAAGVAEGDTNNGNVQGQQSSSTPKARRSSRRTASALEQ